jgi:hypothetical protein
MGLKTQKARRDDLLRNTFHPSYNHGVAQITSATAVPVGTPILGYPVAVTGGTRAILHQAAVAAFTGTSTCGLITDDAQTEVIVNSTASVYKYETLDRGPAIVHRDGLPTTDPAGAAYDMAKLIAALLVAGIVVVDEVGVSGSL